MAETNRSVVQAVVVEDEVRFTLIDLCRACHADEDQLVELVQEGVLDPEGDAPQDWRFGGPALRRARAAVRLSRDLQLSAPGAALVLQLLDEIEALQARLRRAGVR